MDKETHLKDSINCPLYFGVNELAHDKIITERHSDKTLVFGTPGQGKRFTVNKSNCGMLKREGKVNAKECD